jgi:hypothetical protein
MLKGVREITFNIDRMVNYVTTQGIIRDFSDIAIVSVRDGYAKLIQHLTSIKDNHTYFEVREATTPILPGETRDEMAERLNNDSNIIINVSGNLAALKMA